MSAPARTGTFLNTRNGLPQQWHETFRADRMADPEQVYADVKEAHAYVTREMQAAVDPTRQWNLASERKRLAAIAWALKRRWSL